MTALSDAGGHVLVVNAGSSSVKLAVLDPVSGRRALTGLAERVGTQDASVRIDRDGERSTSTPDDVSHAGVIEALLALMTGDERSSITAVGHRVVHGGPTYSSSVVVDDVVRADLEALTPLAPLHLPGNLAGIDATTAALPDLPQVAVFDTAFHRTMPAYAAQYAVPRSWRDDLDVRRYGFHGTSHRYVSGAAAELLGRPPGELGLVTLHLGNGCSAAAVRGGRSVDTTMGFTPLEGLVMGSRSGDIDPGVIPYVAERLGVDAAEVVRRLNTESGLLGVSGTSNDMRTLLEAAAAGDEDAALAVELFCYRAAKHVAALSVALGRLDAVVFTGGIGENSAPVRAAVLARLSVLGVHLDAEANHANGATTGGRISTPGGPVALVVPTDEELLIARDTADLA
ncbi:acetate/propionate family kinase [Longivirga aurantiaca]|uniref:Acetate kinase n=1 Tax=Longivirga aurantiaca TaxID=1837743 RepID=A0ABW1SY76_9ACTN